MQAVRNSSRGVSLLYSSSATYPSATQGVRATQVSIGPTPTLRPDPDRHITTKQGVRPTRASVGSTLTLGRDADRQITTQPSRGQLFTPVASHDPTEGNEHVSQPNFHHEIQNDPGDFGEPFDEEDEEIIELAERIEKSAQTAKSPPSRAHKLNIRDTHEHDDYGGALLSVEERKLLGTSSGLWVRLHILILSRRHQRPARCAQTDRAREISSTYYGPLVSSRSFQHQRTSYLFPYWRSPECRMPSCAQQPKLGSRALRTSHQFMART